MSGGGEENEVLRERDRLNREVSGYERWVVENDTKWWWWWRKEVPSG